MPVHYIEYSFYGNSPDRSVFNPFIEAIERMVEDSFPEAQIRINWDEGQGGPLRKLADGLRYKVTARADTELEREAAETRVSDVIEETWHDVLGDSRRV
jgi:hypothetical protein